MRRGLDDRRIALFAAGDGGDVARTLEQAGARVAVLHDGLPTRDEDWHGGRYAALVIVDANQNATSGEPRLVQLVREFLVSEKPVAVFGGGIQVLLEAGGLEEDAALVARDGDTRDFATRATRELASRLDESQADEMSEQSFPASDAPSTSPTTVGPAAADRGRDARQ